MSRFLPNLAIAGYRSFGSEPQYFDRFAKINLFIGQNNVGKSNILRFLSEVYQPAAEREPLSLKPLAKHLLTSCPLLLGIGEALDECDSQLPALPLDHRLLAEIRDSSTRELAGVRLGKLFSEKSRIDGTPLCWTLLEMPRRKDNQASWLQAIEKWNDAEVHWLWNTLTHMAGGDRKGSWEPKLQQILPAEPNRIQVKMIPSIRQIGPKGSNSDGYDGLGIIERLARPQNPSVNDQRLRQTFAEITDFLRDVTESSDASIEIPYERDTILVHLDGKVLPIESLGSGIHEVVILASAATLLSDHVICIEEPEVHLNPILQRKFIRYLASHTSNQYFITTHSPTLMDTPDAEVYHVTLRDGASKVERVTSSRQRSAVCEDLGYHPSDLLQSNCIIWVEGPSDRIYLNWWLNNLDRSLIEGVHYSIMFYGGRLAAHLTNSDLDEMVEDFISLRRLDRRSMILMDSDRDTARSPINATKRRLREEFDTGPGHAWVTDGREIENYLAPSQLAAALASITPKKVPLTSFGRFDRTLLIGGAGKETYAPKVNVARHIAQTFSPNFSILDLRQRLTRLRSFILASNPPGQASTGAFQDQVSS